MNDLVRRLQRLKKQYGKYRLESYASPRDLAARSVMDLVPMLSGDDAAFEARRPLHLRPLVDFLDEACAPRKRYRLPDGTSSVRQLRSWFSFPIRHWKTVTLRHGVVRHLCRFPEERVLWCSHTQSMAQEQSMAVRRLVQKAGHGISAERGRIDNWDLEGHQGGLVALGTDSGVSGRGYRLIVVDDPFASLSQAESPAERERLWRWLDTDVVSRLSPDGAVVVVHSRWHPDDVIGRLQREAEDLSRRASEPGQAFLRGRVWRGVNVPALRGEAEDKPLLPEVWGLDFLRAERAANPAKFSSLYQGQPRARENVLFSGDVTFQDEARIPAATNIAYGVDFAYSARKSADFSVLLRLLSWTEPDAAGRPVRVYMVEDVVRLQVDAPAFTARVSAAVAARPGRVLWIASGTEKGTAQFVRQRVPSLLVRAASEDKYQRALPASELWNSGRLRVPKDAAAHPWLTPFLYELTSFSGVRDPHDDQVDALAAAVAALRGSSMAEALSSFVGRRRDAGSGWAPPALKVG